MTTIWLWYSQTFFLCFIIVEGILRAFKIDSEPIFCVDNDKTWQAFINVFKIKNKAYEAYLPPDGYKDWNEYLISLEKK